MRLSPRDTARPAFDVFQFEPAMAEPTHPRSRVGVQDGYLLIARQLEGLDVILRYAGREGRWLDRFRPVTALDLEQDPTLYTVRIGDVRYRLVRSVKAVPDSFRYIYRETPIM